jgi:hypothetical protein
MAQRLKRWESPRSQGRNEKGRGGSARQRQLKKRQKRLLKRLKAEPIQVDNENQPDWGEANLAPSFCWVSL